MDIMLVLITVGSIVGTLDTLFGAGGGFIFVSVLLLTNPSLTAEKIDRHC